MFRFLTAFVVACIPCVVFSATIYVDQSNTTAPWYGSQADPFRYITDGATALAASNAVSQGGHLILVAEGVYTNMVVFDGTHSGAVGTPNELRGNGNVVIDVRGNQSYCVHLDGAYDFTVRGIRMTGATAGGLYLDNNNVNGTDENWLIDDCWSYRNGAGISTYRHYINKTVFTNCAVFLNRGGGMYIQSINEITFMNCMFAANARYAMYLRYGGHDIKLTNCVIAGNGDVALSEAGSTSGSLEAHNCLFYANAFANFYDMNDGFLTTADEINSLPDCDGNVVACPGFAGLMTNNPALIYEGSPCIGTGLGGGNIGLDGYTTVPVSSNTYYVNGASGSDFDTGLSPGNAWATIQRAGDGMIAGDTAIIAASTYTENLVITNTGVEGKPVRFLAQQGVVLDGGGNAFGLVLDHASNVEVDGLEIVSCATACAAPSNSYGCTLSKSELHGGGTYGVMVNANRFNGNTEYVSCDIYGHVGNIYLYSGGQMFRKCDIHDASGSAFACRYQYDAATLVANCNVYDNGSGMTLSTSSSICSRNSNIANNDGHGVYIPHAGSHSFVNCNITGNGNYGVYEGVAVKLYYCNLYGNTNGMLYNVGTATGYTDIDDVNTVATPLGNYTNNISVDPQFRNAAAGDFKLWPSSGCVNAGTNSSPLSTDYYGQKRLVGPAVDIGVYELPPSGSIFVFD